MSTELFRKYIDIINEGQQQQINEGMLDSIKQKIAQLAQKMFSPQDMEKMKQAVEQTTGKPIQQVSIRDLGGKNAVAIATALGAKPTAVNEAALNELFGVGKEDPRVAALRQRGYSDEWIKDRQDQADYEKYGFTGSTLVKRIMSIATSLGGLGGLIATVMSGAPIWAGAVALIAFIVGSLSLGATD